MALAAGGGAGVDSFRHSIYTHSDICTYIDKIGIVVISYTSAIRVRVCVSACSWLCVKSSQGSNQTKSEVMRARGRKRA